MKRRPRGDGALYWDESRRRWIATVTVGYDGRGKRVVRKATGRTMTEAKRKLRELLRIREEGFQPADLNLTVAEAVEDFLEHGLVRVQPSTVRRYRALAQNHLIPNLGARRVKDLTAGEVEVWLASLAPDLSTDSLRRLHGSLNRAVRRAMTRDQVRRNVVELVEIPAGAKSRPSKSLTAIQVDAILNRTGADPMHAYIVVSLLTGARTEEMRALRWDHVHLTQPNQPPGSPPHIEVWRSVRSTGDTKTRRSRRTLALPLRAVDALRRQLARQDELRMAAGSRWQESGLVFTTAVGTAMDAANVRRDFRRALSSIEGLDPNDWTPRELRHSFVSVLSDAGVPIEEISRLVGHRGTTVTELIYRHQLRPVLQSGATVMDRLFGDSDSNR